MRKKPILLAAAVVAAGLAVFRTVAAQSPPAAPGQPRVAPAGGVPQPTVRPYGEWTPQPPPAGYVPGQGGGVRQAGGVLPTPKGYEGAANPPGGRPRLTSPVIAGPDGVRPASAGFDIPPPSFDPPTVVPARPTGVLPPPSVSRDPDPADSKFPPIPLPERPAPGPVGPPDATPPPSFPPVGANTAPVGPPAGSNGSQPVGSLPLPTPGGIPVPALPPAGIDTGAAPGIVRPAPTLAGALPGKITQTVTLEAVCPESVVLGGEFRYELIVKNAGTAAASGVRVEDELPAGARYVGSDPPADRNGDHLVWVVGTLEPGAEKRIAVRVLPADEGEVRSRAGVTYAAAVDARTRVTRPRLAVSVTGPEVCKAGDQAVFKLKVTNAGTGPAQKMVLRAMLSEGLDYPHGRELEKLIDQLPAGESMTVELPVGAGKAGAQWCQVAVTAPGSPDAAAKATVNVVEARLEVTQTGPAECLVRAEPEFTITLSNPGTAATDPVTLYAGLPEGFDYVQAGDGAAYSSANRAVVWKLAGLAPGGTKAFTLKLRAATAGDGVLRTVAQATPEAPAGGVTGARGIARPAGKTLEGKAETAVRAKGVAAVRFEVLDLDDPVGVGKEAVYEVRVTNQGTGACTNVQLVAAMAEGTTYTGSSGPTAIKTHGQHLVFDPIATLGVKGEAVYRVKIRGSQPGDMRFRVQLTCDQVRTPVVKEESTRFVKE